MPDFDPATLAALSSLSSGGSSLLSGGTPGADLANFQRTIAANDPYMTAAAPVLNAKFNTSTWTPNQQIATTLGQAALGSILKVLGQRDEGDQLTKVANILPQLYKDPTSVTLPDGVDPGAFAALRIGALGRQSTTQDLIARAIGEKLGGEGVVKNVAPDGTVTYDTSGLSAINGAVAAAKGKTATGNRAQVGLAQDLGKQINAVAALNTAQSEVGNFYGAKTFGADSTIGGIIDSIGQHIPGTNAYQFQKDLPSINGPVTLGLEGTSKQGTLEQNRGMFTQDLGQTASSMITSEQSAQKVVADKIAASIAALAAAGWPETGNPVDANGQPLPNLTDLRNKYAAVASGQGISLAPPADQSSQPSQADLIAEAQRRGIL